MKGLRSTGFALALLALALFFKTCSSVPVHAATHQAVLSWVAPGPMTPPVTYTYNLLRSNVASGPYAPVKTGIPGTTYTDAGLQANTKYCWVVSVSAVGFLDSVNSNEFCATTQKDSAPNASGLAGVVQ